MIFIMLVLLWLACGGYGAFIFYQNQYERSLLIGAPNNMNHIIIGLTILLCMTGPLGIYISKYIW